MTDNDYPAAHSMDTQWFAVDKHGHVGVFESGEAGAVPLEARDPDFYLEDIPPDGVEAYLEDLTERADGKIFLYMWNTKSFVEQSLEKLEHLYHPTLLWLKDESPLESASGGWWGRMVGRKPPTFTRVPHAKHIFAISEELSKQQLGELISAGLVLRAWIGYSIEPQRLGFFVYEHGDEFENWISGPYVRRGEPKQIVKLDALPEAVRDKIGTFRMPEADFPRDRVIQPKEHHECANWQNNWVDLDGEVHESNDE